MLGSQYIPYATVAFIGAAALSHFSKNIRQYAPDTEANRFFRVSILGLALCALMEFLYVFHESGLLIHPVFCYGSEICYSTASLFSAFTWFLNSEIEQNEVTVRNHRNRILCALPFAVMILLTLSTPWHHLLFSFTADGHYVRGPLSTAFVVLSAVYIAKSGVFALVKSFQKQHYLNRNLYRTFFYYALTIMVSQLLQIVLGSVLPFRVIGAVFLFYLVQERTIKANVLIDMLTQANNRAAMERYLKANFESADSHFTYVMIDLDDFKQINDTYGHNRGDTALCLVSSAFRKVIPSGMFFGRYGGDEFVLIGRSESADEIPAVMKQVDERIGELCKQQKLPFRPAFSYGVACKTPEITSLPELMDKADAAMYACKQKRKSGN